MLLSRRAHAQKGFELKGSAVRAYTPCNPEPQDEAWYIFLTDPANNYVVSFTKVRGCVWVCVWGWERGAQLHAGAAVEGLHQSTQHGAHKVTIP